MIIGGKAMGLRRSQRVIGATPSINTSTTENCVQEAIGSDYDQWVCFGTTVSYIESGLDGRGKQTEGGWTSRTIGAGESQTTTTPMAGTSDPDDSWCENASICHSDINDYISKTKGNAAYGNQNGIIGTFDVILRTNLNGRQPRYTVKYIRDTGPTLTIKGTVNCVKDQVVDGTCGHYSVGTRTVSSIYKSALINTDRIANDKPDNYFSTITGTFTAKGYSTKFTLGTLRSKDFDCPRGSGSCKFP